MERYFRIKLKKLQRIVLKPSGLWIISEKDDRNSILWTVCVIQNTVVWTKMGVNRTAVNVPFHQKCPIDGVRVQGGANWNIASIWHQKNVYFHIFLIKKLFPLQHRLVRGFSHSILNKYSSFKNQIFERKNFKRKKLLELSQSRISTRTFKTSRSSLFFVTPRGLVDLVPIICYFLKNGPFFSPFRKFLKLLIMFRKRLG